MPPMAALGWQHAAASSQRLSGGKPKPVRFSPEQRKVVLAELAALEDVRVRSHIVPRTPARRGCTPQPPTDPAAVPSQLFDAGQALKNSHKAVDVSLVPRLDFSCLHSSTPPRRPQQMQATGTGVPLAAHVAAPAEASPDAKLPMMPPSKPAAAAIANLGPLAMLPPKQPAMRREYALA